MYIFYAYALYKTTYFVWSRWYLLSAIFISILIPLLPFPYSISDNYINSNFLLLNTYSGFGVALFKEPANSWRNIFGNPHFNIQNIIFVVYISGFIRAAIVFVRKNLKIFKIIQQCDIQNIEQYKLVPIQDENSAYSWFKYIFISKNHQLSEQEISYIIEHEKIHIKQCHSCDLLLYELFGIWFWFSPFVKKAQQTIRNIHEFIVDSIMLSKFDAKLYSELLLKLSENKRSLSVVNNFAKNPILDRIWLIVFPNNLTLSKIRFASGMPLMIVSVLFYSFLISEINKSTNSLQFKNNYDFVMPVAENYKIVSPFFEKKYIKNSEQKGNYYKVLVSHLEISISTKSHSKIMASRQGVVKNVEIIDNWGVEEINIEIAHNKGFTSIYKGLKKSFVEQNDTVKQAQIIGVTGDNRLYPTINFKLLKNKKPVNPMEYLNK